MSSGPISFLKEVLESKRAPDATVLHSPVHLQSPPPRRRLCRSGSGDRGGRREVSSPKKSRRSTTMGRKGHGGAMFLALSWKHYLQNHMRSQEGEVIFRCEECAYAVTEYSDFIMHQRVHRFKEKEIAGKQISNTQLHKSIHSIQKI